MSLWKYQRLKYVLQVPHRGLGLLPELLCLVREDVQGIRTP